MKTSKTSVSKDNRFKKILDDAGRALRTADDFSFLNNVPQASDSNKARIPFPYGKQPGKQAGWELPSEILYPYNETRTEVDKS